MNATTRIQFLSSLVNGSGFEKSVPRRDASGSRKTNFGCSGSCPLACVAPDFWAILSIQICSFIY
jgi:hypothetical protein